MLRTLFLSREQRVLERVMVVLTSFRKNSVMALLKFLYTGEIGRNILLFCTSYE